tara:strand:- start:45 stop:1022 length:978 start_codon:yes stop_codon:yes gene_type:complete
MAGLTTTQTFSDGDTVTAAKLNNIVSNASIDADAVTTAKILNANVTLAKMATGSVDTGQLVADSVENSKLNDMAARTVKVNATDAAANPTDIPMSNGVDVAENKLLVGTTDSINAVKFDTDLELDATDSAAADIRVAATLIGGKASVTADELDEILIKSATDGALKRATVKTAVQSQVATTVATGVCELATATKLIDPTSAVANDVISASTGSSMLAKAWAKLNYNKIGTNDTGTLTVNASFNLDIPTHDFATYRGLITFPITTDLNSSVTDYCIMAHAHYLDGTTAKACVCEVTLDTNASFTIQFKAYSGAVINPSTINLVIFA